ncbi:MAG: histidine phosphatase family protein [Chloroflexota bacterium]|nr:histidine phosphatase family protein [Chloroflexota bacterium]
MTSAPPGQLPDLDRYPLLRHPVAGDTTLFLVRHGRTHSNRRRLLHGVTDVPLDGLGVRQAERVGERLRREARPDVLISSPLSRALTTARAIGKHVGLEPTVVPTLIEMDFGALEGATIEGIALEHPDLAERIFALDDGDLTWPDGESRGGFNARVLATFLAILEDHPAHRAVVVAHGGVIGSFLAQVQGRSPNDPAIYDVHNCGVTHLRVTAEQTVVHCRNDVFHLDGLVDPEEEGQGCD